MSMLETISSTGGMSMAQSKSLRFELGCLFMSHGINAERKDNANFAQEITIALTRYMACDWGDLTKSDKELNDEAVKSGSDRILAAFPTSKGKIYIITEWNREYTTVLFPNEY